MGRPSKTRPLWSVPINEKSNLCKAKIAMDARLFLNLNSKQYGTDNVFVVLATLADWSAPIDEKATNIWPKRHFMVGLLKRLNSSSTGWTLAAWSIATDSSDRSTPRK